MPKLSVYRQGQPYEVLEGYEVVTRAYGDADDKMIELMHRTHHAVLVTIANVPCIVKEVEIGDHEKTFEYFYDDCYTFVDLQRMQRRGVDTPEAAQLDTYRVDLHMAVDGHFTISVWTRAHNHGDARRRIEGLLANEVEVAEAVKTAVLREIAENSEVTLPWRVHDVSNNVPQLEDGKDWDVTLPREDRDRE